MLLFLLSLGAGKPPGERRDEATIVNLEAAEVAQAPAEPTPLERQQMPEEQPVRQPQTDEPPPISPLIEPTPPPPAARSILTTTVERVPAPPPVRPTRPAGPLYGPPDTGRSPMFRDSERVGTAPNGEPLYAAAWYREPKDEMLRDYLSTALGPGWGLIACRTAPDYRVEDCVGLAEYPEGSQIVRAILAAAWEFKVRPPRLGGQSLVGSWVRIRIDYERR